MNKPNQPQILRVVGIAHDIDSDRYFVDFEFMTVDGRLRTVPLRRDLSERDMAKELLQRGAQLPHGHAQATKIIQGLLQGPSPTYDISAMTGWLGNSFRLTDEIIGPAAASLKMRPRSGLTMGPPTLGTLDAWKRGLKQACAASSYLTTNIAFGFAGPLLKVARISESTLIYLRGPSCTGKTTGLTAAASVVGRPDMPTLDITDRAIEEKAAEANDLVLPLDEAARIKGGATSIPKMLDDIGHRVASGQGRVRSRKATLDDTLTNLTWRTIAIATGETPLNDGTARQRGAQVRSIEVVVPPTEQGGIFDRCRPAGPSPIDLAQMVNETIAANYGVAIRAFLNKFVPNFAKYEQRANEFVEHFIKKVGAGSDAWERRFATKPALGYAAGKLAAEFGVAPWRPKDVFSRVARVYRRSRENLFTADKAADDLLRQLADRDRRKRLFPMVSKGRALPAKRAGAPGFRRKQKGTIVLALHRARLKDLVRPPHLTDEVVKVLDRRGMLLPGKNGRYVRQIQVRGFGDDERPYFIVIPLAKLKGA